MKPHWRKLRLLSFSQDCASLLIAHDKFKNSETVR